MMGAKFDVEKFDGTGDFGLWRIKMRALLIQHRCEAALEVLPVDMEAEVWLKLETLYMTNSLANKFYLKKKLYTFYMPAGRKISEHIHEFNKIVLDLANIEVKFEDGDLALLLLTSLPASYKHFVDTLLYGQKDLTLEDVMATLNSKKIKERYKAKGDDGEGLYVRGRTYHRDLRQSRRKSRSKSQGGRLKGSARLDHGFRMFIPHDTQSGKVKVINGSSVVLSGIRMDNCVYSLDGHTVADELNASVEEKDSLAQDGIGLYPQLWIESGIARHLTVAGTPQQNGSSSTAIEKKTPIEMWSGHPSDYEMLRVFGCVAYSHVKQGTWSSMKGLNNHTLKKDQTDQEDGDDDAGDLKTDQTHDLTDYQLVRDRDPRTRTKPLRFRDESNMVFYTFVATKEKDTHEPLTYQEAVACEDSSKWKVIYALTACKDYELDQLDVKTAFLHGNLKEVIDMRQPPGYVQGEYIYLLLYVSDMLIACKSKAKIGSTKSLLKKEFDMKELGEAKKIIENGKSVKMPLGGHFKLSLKDCQVRDCDVERMSKVSYAYVVGSLLYLMVCTRPDIAYTVSIVSRYLANPGKNHWEAVKWILKYLQGTANVGLVYGKNHGNHVDVIGFVDSDYANDPNKGRSITGYTFLVQGCVVGTEHNAADALTKVVPGLKLQHCLELLNVGIG
ncbi:retrovirus-related pol polyprotein from transposon TNT 1-94 [Tanacetum coccineum]